MGRAKPRFDTEAKGNSEVACCKHHLANTFSYPRQSRLSILAYEALAQEKTAQDTPDLIGEIFSSCQSTADDPATAGSRDTAHPD